jgi:4-hydroxy-tetrahydrodipicolinate synthase
VVAPTVTPFTADGGIDLGALRRNTEWLFERGARQGNTIVLVAGSGGDFTSMSVAERQQVIRMVAEVVDGRLPVIAGAQAVDVRDTIAIAQLCEDLGVDAIQIAGPYYYDGLPGDVLEWFRTVARHTRVGFAIYNNWYTGYNMPVDLISQLLELPNSVGVKWGAPDVNTYIAGMRRFIGQAAVVNNSMLTVLGHLMGARAFVSHLPNYYPEWCWRLWDLMEAGRHQEAQHEFDRVMGRYQALIAPIRGDTAGEGVFVRPFMEAVGLTGGVSRLPSRDAAVTDELRQRIRAFLREIGALG